MVDLEALEKFYAHHGWIHDEPWKELLSELRALRAERDAYDGDLTRSIARIAELTRLGMSVVDALGHISHNNQWGLYQAVDAWRRAVRG